MYDVITRCSKEAEKYTARILNVCQEFTSTIMMLLYFSTERFRDGRWSFWTFGFQNTLDGIRIGPTLSGKKKFSSNSADHVLYIHELNVNKASKIPKKLMSYRCNYLLAPTLWLDKQYGRTVFSRNTIT